MDFKGIGWYAVDWIDVTEDRYQWLSVVKMVMNLQVP
jgi:hypothetical protein